MKSVRITFKPRSELILPLAHFDILQGLFYKLLSYDTQLASKVHSGEGRMRRYKFCCFTDISGRRIVEGKSLVFSDHLQWEIRSMDDSVAETIAAGLKENRRFKLADIVCEVEKLAVCQSEFFGTRMIFAMDTPVVLYTTAEDGHNFFRSPADEDFCEMAEKNLISKFREYYDTPIALPVSFRPARVSERDKCVTRFMGTYITGYYGLYELEAQTEMINLAYYSGIGSKNTQGFGTIKQIRGEH